MEMDIHQESQVLVAYFSHSGNTEALAKEIVQETGAKLCRIVPAHAYPKDYNAVVDIAQVEKRQGSRPALASVPADVSNQDTIFLGYPNWWATMPMPVFTFLESCDLSGVAIAPFCTHEGSGLGKSLQDIRRLCPRSEVLEGLALRGNAVRSAAGPVRRWLEALKIPVAERGR